MATSGRTVIAWHKQRHMPAGLALTRAGCLWRLLGFVILILAADPLAPVKAVMTAVGADKARFVGLRNHAQLLGFGTRFVAHSDGLYDTSTMFLSTDVCNQARFFLRRGRRRRHIKPARASAPVASAIAATASDCWVRCASAYCSCK